MAYSFTDSMKQLVEATQNFIVLLVAMLPFLVVLGIIITVGCLSERSIGNGNQKKM